MPTLAQKSLILQQSIPYRMVKLAGNISDAMSEIYTGEFGISLPEWRIIAQLAEQDSLLAKDIGELTSMDKSRVSRAVKTLQDKQYINKDRDERDARASYLSLTENGRALYHRIVPKALAWEAELISTLDSDEYRDLMRILEKLDRGLQTPKPSD
jgi:DNA-binding MarR family transcriptional regulator